MAVVLAGCGDDEETSDPGCAIYSDFLADLDDPTDAEAVKVLREVEDATEDPQVRSYATAMRARLEDGADITTSFQGLGKACGLL